MHYSKEISKVPIIKNPNLLSCTLAVVVEGITGSSNTSGSLGLLLLMVVLLKQKQMINYDILL